MTKHTSMRGASGVRVRLIAAGVHLVSSAIVGAVAAALVFGLWYPTPFREISGGRELFLLVVTVDVILGPLITFAIFSLQKPRSELRLDLAIVVCLQLAALAYGLHTVWVARPVYLVFEVDRFRVVRALDIEAEALQRAPEAFRSLSNTGPKLIAAVPPTDEVAKLKSIEMALAGVDINMQPETWRPYESVRASALARAKPLSMLRLSLPNRGRDIDAILGELGVPIEALGFLPIIARETGWVALVDLSTAEIKGYLPFGGF